LDKEGIDPTEQRLMFAGKELSDDAKKMQDYEVQDRSTVFLLLRLIGGNPETD